MKTHTTGESATAHSDRQAASTRQAAQLQNADSSAMADTSATRAAQQRYQQIANNSPQAMQLKQRKEMMAASTSIASMCAATMQMKAAVQRAPDEELLQGRFDAVQRIEEEDLLQGKFEQTTSSVAASSPVQREVKANDTGLPNDLKSGIESLSGMSMGHVKVYYNSDKPAQLQAHAYAQGSDIHVASGQEQHLPHEAWHVVQQAQGRVKPTMQMKGGVPVNDDVGLEREADLMGAKALGVGPLVEKRNVGMSELPPSSAGLLQGRFAAVQRRGPEANEPMQRKFGPVIQRAVKWWPTNASHTAVTGGPSDKQPDDGTYVKRDKAGPNDELLSTEGDAWARAKDISLQYRPENTVLFPGTTEKMVRGDGDRTYLTKAGSKKAVSIVVTHTTDPQSQVQTEKGVNLKVIHSHSASGNFAQVSPALANKEHPAYTNNAESKVHYLSLTLQAGEVKSENKDDKSNSETDTDDEAASYSGDSVGKEDLSDTEDEVVNRPQPAPAITLGWNELMFAHVAGYTNPSMLLHWRGSAAYAEYKKAIETHKAPLTKKYRDKLIGWIKINKQD